MHFGGDFKFNVSSCRLLVLNVEKLLATWNWIYSWCGEFSQWIDILNKYLSWRRQEHDGFDLNEVFILRRLYKKLLFRIEETKKLNCSIKMWSNGLQTLIFFTVKRIAVMVILFLLLRNSDLHFDNNSWKLFFIIQNLK